MTKSEKQQVFTLNISYLIHFAFLRGLRLTFGEASRSYDQVLLNYYGYEVVKSGNTIELKKKAPVSKTLNSKHLERLAVDFNFFVDGKLVHKHELIDAVGEFWKQLDPNNVWGGDWKVPNDPYHFEMK